MTTAKRGDTVRVHYTGTLQDGTVFDSSFGREPLELTLGEEQVIPGFEEALLGMAPGEKKKSAIPVDRAYGPRRSEMVADLSRKEFPGNIAPQVGLALQLKQKDGRSFQARVTGVTETTVTLDANHALAGHDLTFEIELVAIVRRKDAGP